MLDKILHTPWHFMRWIRLIVGGWAVSNFVRAWMSDSMNTMEYVVLAAGIYFIYKALFNTGCEVQQPYSSSPEDEITTVDYEEIK